MAPAALQGVKGNVGVDLICEASATHGLSPIGLSAIGLSAIGASAKQRCWRRHLRHVGVTESEVTKCGTELGVAS